MTMEQMMVYGGIAIIALGILAICLYVPLFARQRKKLEKAIQEEYTS